MLPTICLQFTQFVTVGVFGDVAVIRYSHLFIQSVDAIRSPLLLLVITIPHLVVVVGDLLLFALPIIRGIVDLIVIRW